MLLDQLYGSATAARNALYDRGVLKPRRLAGPVVSVGNIAAGGSGKTPFVIALGELLAGRNIEFDVLSRGYRRSTHGVLIVDPQGTPEQFGDEPLLIARKLRCRVVVGKDRYSAGLKAEEQSPHSCSTAIHLLDDGFQHRRLHRDFNIVLLNREDLDDRLLPTGRLREPLSALARADATVIDFDFPRDRIPTEDYRVWRVERRVDLPQLAGPVIAFCGIARPQRFFSALRKHGIDVREEIVFRDHHRYNDQNVQELAAAAARIHGSRFITTEKDAINLGTNLAILNPVVVPLKIQLLTPETALDYLLSKTVSK